MSNTVKKREEIRLSDHFTAKRLIRFVMPSIIMMIFTSIYSVVDGLFVSNYVGKTAFAALNLIYPPLAMLGGLGFMIGTGGSAIVAMTLGEGKKDKANEYFSFLIYVTIAVGLTLTVVGFGVLRPIAMLLGAQGRMLENCLVYGWIILAFQTAFMLQFVFQSFFVTAEKPKLGLAVTVAAGLTNVVLDYLLVGVFRFGLLGAAVATGMSQVVGGVLPLVYFAGKNGSLLKLTKAKWNKWVLVKTCTNGSSELMSNISASVVNILYNYQLMLRAGENGVAAYGVMMYMSFVFSAVYLGYAVGCAPIISFHYGAANRDELKNLFRKGIGLNGAAGLFMIAAAQLAADPLMRIFVGYDGDLFAMTRDGFRLYAMAFLITGLNIFGSAFFTALGNGGVSALISFLRTLVFQVLSVLILPVYLGVSGIWLAVVVAEVLSLAVTAGLLMANRKKYGFG
ncbi:MAG: MATE family efflux transporter [Hungatella sp.]|jgi:putative MATE family efflux protein|nr:MATE family efflux transporter [Hungatella sp.]